MVRLRCGRGMRADAAGGEPEGLCRGEAPAGHVKGRGPCGPRVWVVRFVLNHFRRHVWMTLTAFRTVHDALSRRGT